MKKFLFFALGLSLFSASAQQPVQRCATPNLPQQFETWVQSLAPVSQGSGKNGGAQSTMSTFNIPVIVHVIHNNEAVNSVNATTGNNLNAAQIIDQINILNRDFNGLNPDTVNIPAVFKPFLGKFNFNFCLAVVNPTGGVLAEPGIDRINRNSKGWTWPNQGYTTTYIDGTIKPQSIWDPNRYLNMWVCPISGGILGYATFPQPGTSGLQGLTGSFGTNTTDGLVMLNTAFGSIGTAVNGAPYNKGRTTVHEIGHWVGLRHIWGDGNCATDYCNDTPPAQTSNFGCPTHPYKLGTCAGNTTGEMTMNFMDYTDDACMYMFSNDQKYRAQLIMTNSPMRLTLLSSTVCNLPSVTNDLGITFVSSPTYSQVINCNNFINPVIRVNNYGANVVSAATFTFKVDNAAPQTYSWTGTIASSGSVNISLPQISNLTNGAHVFTVGITNVNGASDSNNSNNGDSQSFLIANSFTLSATASPTSICSGQTATLTATGGATGYTWTPGNLVGTTAAVSPAATTIYTLSGKSGTCTNIQTTTVTVGGSLNITVNSPTICAGIQTVITASGASTYTWSTGANTSTINVTPLITTVYTVSGTSGGCSGNKTATVTVNTTPTVSVNSSTICSGSPATLTAGGATSYSWNTGSTSAAINVTPSVTTIYTVTGSNGNCSNTKTATVTVNTTPTVSVNSASICSGSTATLTATGAASYSWNTGATTSVLNVSPVSTTVYTVTGTSGSCDNVKTVTVTVNTNPTVSVNSATVCSGNTATLTATGATSYSWNTGATGGSINVGPAVTTVYTVTGSNGNCSNTKTATITVNATPTVVVNSTSICAGSAATLTASGAGTYNWNTGATTAVINVTPSSTTVYTVTGITGSCSNVKTATVTVNITPTVSVNSATICSGSSATLSANGASAYSWNTGASTAVINVSPASTTVYTVTGSNGTCSNVKTATVTVNTSPTISVNSSTICSGNNTSLNASGATTYSWNTGATTSGISVSPLVTTIYTVTGTNGGCSNTKTSTVTVNATPTVNVTSFTICSGGSATLTASGASSYSWNTGSTSNPLVISPTSTTVYTVTGTSNGCSSVNTATVSVGSSIAISLNPSVQTVCAGNTATLSASGAVNYNWSNGATGASIVVNPSSNTSYTVTGTSGVCSGTNTAMVNVSPNASVSVPTQSILCNGLSTGAATISATGGVAPFTYSFSTGATSQIVNSLSAGNYTATVTTGNGCVSSKTFAIVEPAPIVLNSSIVNTSCGLCNGSVSYTASGGTAGYSYTFVPGVNPTALCAGSYSVITADANGCNQNTTLFVNASAGVNVSATSASASCGTCADGSATVTAAGGSWPYSYQWLPSGGTASVATGLTPGCYTVSVTDQAACSRNTVVCVGFVTGITSSEQQQMNLFPNPTTGKISIEFTSAKERNISVIDIAGRILVEDKSSENMVQLNLSEFSNAVYYIFIKDEDQTKRFKIIKH